MKNYHVSPLFFVKLSMPDSRVNNFDHLQSLSIFSCVQKIL